MITNQELSGEVRVFGRPLEQETRHLAFVPLRSSIDWDFPTRIIDLVDMSGSWPVS